MKKILLGLCLVFLSVFAFSQQGMDGIIVEKYYVANAADHAFDNNLPVGAVTYRIYIDMKDGWQLQSIGGDPDKNQEMRIETSTSFYNETNNGAAWADAINKSALTSGTVMLDSWLTMGAVAKKSGSPTNYYYGIPKSEDNGANTIVNANGVLQNTDPKAGIPLTTQDGLIAATTPVGVTITPTPLLDPMIAMLDGSDPVSKIYTQTDVSYFTTGICTGPNSDNKVLIGQFTTDGIFTFKLNCQIRRISDFLVERYVCENEAAGGYLLPGLWQTLGAPSTPPTVSGLTVNPASVIIGSTVNLAVTATDNVSVSKVEFFRGAVKIGEDLTTPYELTYTTDVVGTFNITTVATDNEGTTATSSPVSLVVSAVPANIPPVVGVLTVPANVNVGATVNGSATATDADGSIANIEFFVNNVSIGIDASSPYEFSFVAGTEGNQTVKAIATDNGGAKSSAKTAVVNVQDPLGAPYSIVSDTLSCLESDFFYMPVVRTRKPLTNVIGFDVVMNFDKTKVEPTGFIRVNNDLISDSLLTAYNVDIKDGKMNISLYLNGTAPAGTSFNGLGQLMAVEFNKTAEFGNTDLVNFSISSDSLVESYNTGIKKEWVKPGTFTSFKDSLFAGALKFWADNSPIAYTNGTNLITKVFGSDNNCVKTAYFVTPNASGNFSFNITKAQNINIDRDIPAAKDVMSVISGYDAMLTKKVLVDNASFIPGIFQMIAMDVNADGTVSAGDLSQINQRTAKVIDEFRQKWNYNDDGSKKATYAASKDWVFVDNRTLVADKAYRKSNTYPKDDNNGYSKWRVPVVAHCVALPVSNLTSCPFIETEVYQGILLGDVNGNYKNIAPDVQLKSTKAAENESVVFDMSNATISEGYITVPVSVSADYDVNSLDFGMTFNKEKLTFSSIIDNTEYLETLGYFNEADQTLRVTSYSLQNYELGKAIISLRFKTNSTTISSADILSAKAYVNENPSVVEVTELLAMGTPEITYELINVYPNPASDFINIVLLEKANIQLLDVNGRIVLTLDLDADQKHMISVANLPEGIYMMRIYNQNGQTMKKVVVKR